MRFQELVKRLDLTVTEPQRAACLELESRGLSFCTHFGYENAEDILYAMDVAFQLGILYEWMSAQFGIGGAK